jgi:hypothetical protein
MTNSTFFCPDYHGDDKGKLLKVKLVHIGAIGKRRLYACPRDGHLFVKPKKHRANSCVQFVDKEEKQ